VSDAIWLRIDVAAQRLDVCQGERALCSYPVSTARNGVGERNGSGCTPRGSHYVRARIGAGLPRAAVLKGRRPTGEIWSEALAAQYPSRDWILSRILWLCGREPGRNRLGAVDTQRRYIYIHGTPDTEPMGVPLSHGCIRMRNDDVMALFDLVPAGTRVEIDSSLPRELMKGTG
jgi:L,D-transpeptidase YbiS